MGNNINSKTFTLNVYRVKEFTLKIIGFPISTAISILMLISKLQIVITTRLKKRKSISLKIKKLIIRINGKLNKRESSDISLKKINFTTNMRLIFKKSVSVLIRIPITIIMRLKFREILNINTGFQHITLTVISEILKKLSEFDPQTLSALDGLTLGQMDHT